MGKEVMFQNTIAIGPNAAASLMRGDGNIIIGCNAAAGITEVSNLLWIGNDPDGSICRDLLAEHGALDGMHIVIVNGKPRLLDRDNLSAEEFGRALWEIAGAVSDSIAAYRVPAWKRILRRLWKGR